MKKIIIFVIVVLSFSLNAEIVNNAFTPDLLMPSIINMDNFTVNHTISFHSSISSNSQSAYESVYTNHMLYEFNPKLSLKVDLNFVNFGSATYQGGIEFEGNDDNSSAILPNFQLNYKPTDSFNLIIEYKQYNSTFERPYLFK
ncbi:MAG: hypothetical protein K9N07_03390 [Candidatus Cloacimonetes bacterium]|nr:hypothetical protein [Candidatus Cloacimonadota bacterium]